MSKQVRAVGLQERRHGRPVHITFFLVLSVVVLAVLSSPAQCLCDLR